jgi:ubiquinone/menaquinone biosynthesis C-methylase UbiE
MSKHDRWQVSAAAAEQYERVVARYIFRPWTPLLLEAVHLAEGERVLDVACGTGIVARMAAERVGPRGRVVGVDLNPGMIRVAGSLPATAGAPIEWIERDALDLGLPEASFDAVLCQQGFQFFPDKALALREMRRVLVRGGGRLALSVWNSLGLYNSAVGRALARLVSVQAADAFGASRRQGPTERELQRLGAEAGFSKVDVRISRTEVHLPHVDQFTLDHLAATPVASAVAAADCETRMQIGASVKDELQRYADGDGVTYPEETFVLTAET